MDLKRVSAAALALAMVASVPAFAAGEPIEAVPTSALLISPNPNAIAENFAGSVSLDGKEITEVTYTYSVEDSWEEIEKVIPIGELPGAPAGYVPMRLLCQASYNGAASWYPEENRSQFTINGHSIITDFNDNSVYLMNENYEEVLQEGVTCFLRDGVTYLPASFLNTLDGIHMDSQVVDGVEQFVSTIDVEPMVKLVRDIATATNFFSSGETTLKDAEYLASMEFTVDNKEDMAAIFPFMTSPDSIIIIKVKEGAMEDVKAELEAYRQKQAETFSWYLSHNLPKVENASMVENGDYVMLYIGEEGTNEQAIELFQAGVEQLEAAN